MKPLGIYLHIPFCQKKCYYCDFISYSGKEELIEDYIESLKKEIQLYREELSGHSIKSIFIGGGTPSILTGGQVEEIIRTLANCYHLEKGIEVSIEANPGLLSREKLQHYYAAGINRLSIGLQACQEHLLQRLGRIHQYKDFIGNLQEAKAVGFNNINVDLMFGLPTQTLGEWHASLENIVALGIPHISAYNLIFEEGTPFFQWMEEGRIQKADEELELRMYHDAIGFLKDNGYLHYEISNFAKPNHQCQHNILYWKNQEYIGFGVAAHSYINNHRFYNHSGIEEYSYDIQNHQKPIEESHSLSIKEEISETMFLGLRMMEGVNVKDFVKRFGRTPEEIYGKQLKKLKERQLITYDDYHIKLTSKGIDLANLVFEEMLLD